MIEKKKRGNSKNTPSQKSAHGLVLFGVPLILTRRHDEQSGTIADSRFDIVNLFVECSHGGGECGHEIHDGLQGRGVGRSIVGVGGEG